LFTIETEMDETLITIMDVTGELEDVSVLLLDKYAHVRQWNEARDRFNVITMQIEMYWKLMEAWKLTDGTYVVTKKSEQK